MIRRLLLASLGLWLFLPCTSAFAYWSGVIPKSGIELKEGPGPQFRTIRRLAKGTPFNSVDTPQQGYYRVRTATETGWISAAQVGYLKRYWDARHRRPVYNKDLGYSRFSVKAMLGYDFSSPSDLNGLIGTKDFSSAVSFGGEVEYFFSEGKAIALRVDQIGKEVSGSDTTTGDTFDLKLSSTSIVVGPEFVVSESDPLVFSLGVMVGIAPTTFTSTDTTQPAPNQVVLSATAITALATAEADWRFSEHFSLFAELAFRYLSTSAITPTLTDSGNPIHGSTIFVQPGYTINLTGGLIGVGVRTFF